VFDDQSLEHLYAFASHRSVKARDEWLATRDSSRENELAKGDLAGWLIARYGTDDEALDERDWEMLEDWGKKGMPAGENVSR
jgi:hypothetical protein